MRLKDKVALITGASSRIRRETAILFSKEGAKIVAVDMNDVGGRETVALVETHVGQAVYVPADSHRSDQLELAGVQSGNRPGHRSRRRPQR